MDESHLNAFVAEYREKNDREPSAAELERFKNNWFKEELLYREGLALGLNRNDPVIRERIVKKMQLLLADVSPSSTPSDEELNDFLKQHADFYQLPARYSFEWVYPPAEIVPARDGASGVDSEAALLSLLEQLNNTPQPGSLNLDRRIHRERTAASIRATFGDEFFAILKDSAVLGNWSLAASRRAVGFVKLLEVAPATLPPFEQLRDRLIVDWNKAVKVKAVEDGVTALQSRYQIQWY